MENVIPVKNCFGITKEAINLIRDCPNTLAKLKESIAEGTPSSIKFCPTR